jgi:hypothetical protein
MKTPFVTATPLFAAGLLLMFGATSMQAAEPTYLKTTPWGDPDLQGIWSYASLTPLQRPTRLGDQEFYTADEAVAINARSVLDTEDAPGDPGSYNPEWFDKGNVSLDLRTSLIIDPPNGRLPLRPEASERLATERAYRRERDTDSWEFRSNWDRCISYHGVPPISTGYNNTYQILQSPGYVTIYVEMIHDVRIIPVDGLPPLGEKIRQWNGDSRGYWDGETLVVETANFSDKTAHRFPSSRNTRTVERFTRVGDDMIDYQFTVEDPDLYTKAWTAVRPMPRLNDYTLYEYACHEGNYAMTNILRGARVLEALDKEDEEN